MLYFGGTKNTQRLLVALCQSCPVCSSSSVVKIIYKKKKLFRLYCVYNVWYAWCECMWLNVFNSFFFVALVSVFFSFHFTLRFASQNIFMVFSAWLFPLVRRFLWSTPLPLFKRIKLSKNYIMNLFRTTREFQLKHNNFANPNIKMLLVLSMIQRWVNERERKREWVSSSTNYHCRHLQKCVALITQPK